MKTPILFVVFNRPSTTRQVFEAIRAARPERLYVAADGPRASRAGEAAVCEEVRTIATAVDWRCQVSTLFRESNHGCRNAVSEAISWFFEHEPEGIILEDDCLPSMSFFPFCESLLERYREDDSVGIISGNNFQPASRTDRSSYYFSKYAHIWGWASWRRYWRQYDRELSGVELPQIVEALTRVSDGSRWFVRYWGDTFLRVKGDSRYTWRDRFLPTVDTTMGPPPVQPPVNTWDYQLFFTGILRAQPALHIVPRVNLVRNIGFETGGTHIVAGSHNPAQLSFELQFPLRHPSTMSRDVEADRYCDLVHYGISASTFFRRALSQKFPRAWSLLRDLKSRAVA